MTDCNREPLHFSSLGPKAVVADFQGGRLSSDTGALLLREVANQIGLFDALNAAIPDPRNLVFIIHDQRAMIAQRIAAIAMGYEDLNDHQTLRADPVLQIVAGKPPEHYKAVAAFFNYLSSPEVQSASHKRTGYLPITLAAFKLTEQSGFYKENPGADVAVNQMIRKTTDKSRGIRLGNFLQIRTIIDEELEQVWAGKADAKSALDRAVKRGNEQLERFQAANKS